MNEPVYFYILVDPRTQAVRYVGKTVDVERRYNAHCAEVLTTHNSLWIQTLRALGLKPDIQVIDNLIDDQVSWKEREKFWISFYREQGHNLTNHSEGGDGHDGVECASETKFKIGLANNGQDNGRAKLTNEQVYEIRVRYSKGETSQILANIYKVSRSSIKALVCGDTWRGVSGPTTRNGGRSHERITKIQSALEQD